MLAYSLGCSNCESSVFTGVKGFPVWINVLFFCSFYCLQLLFLFCFSVWLSSACPKAEKLRVSKDVCVTAAVWNGFVSIYCAVNIKRELVWRIEVYFRLFTVTLPVTPFVRYVKVVGCELSREYVSLFPTSSKTTARESASHGRMTTNTGTVSCKYHSAGVPWNFTWLRLRHSSYCPFMPLLGEGGNVPNRVT